MKNSAVCWRLRLRRCTRVTLAIANSSTCKVTRLQRTSRVDQLRLFAGRVHPRCGRSATHTVTTCGLLATSRCMTNRFWHSCARSGFTGTALDRGERSTGSDILWNQELHCRTGYSSESGAVHLRCLCRNSNIPLPLMLWPPGKFSLTPAAEFRKVFQWPAAFSEANSATARSSTNNRPSSK